MSKHSVSRRGAHRAEHTSISQYHSITARDIFCHHEYPGGTKQTANLLPVPGRTQCHGQSTFSHYNRESKWCRSKQLNGSQMCFSAAFLHSIFMYLA